LIAEEYLEQPPFHGRVALALECGLADLGERLDVDACPAREVDGDRAIRVARIAGRGDEPAVPVMPPENV
jgi:hypothetical protein